MPLYSRRFIEALLWIIKAIRGNRSHPQDRRDSPRVCAP
jgi:hypothetical protein